MDIEGLGEKQAERFLSDGLISGIADIYELDAERLRGLEGFGEVSIRNLLEAIERSKGQPFNRVLYGLGIPGIGFVNARALTGHFRTMDALASASPEQIEQTPGIGPILARTIAETLAQDGTRELIARLREHGLAMEEEGRPADAIDGPLKGKTLVLTGTLPSLSREEATQRIEAAGGRSRAPCRRRPTTSWRARIPDRSWRRRRRWVQKCSTSRGCWRCSTADSGVRQRAALTPAMAWSMPSWRFRAPNGLTPFMRIEKT